MQTQHRDHTPSLSSLAGEEHRELWQIAHTDAEQLYNCKCIQLSRLPSQASLAWLLRFNRSFMASSTADPAAALSCMSRHLVLHAPLHSRCRPLPAQAAEEAAALGGALLAHARHALAVC